MKYAEHRAMVARKEMALRKVILREGWCVDRMGGVRVSDGETEEVGLRGVWRCVLNKFCGGLFVRCAKEPPAWWSISSTSLSIVSIIGGAGVG